MSALESLSRCVAELEIESQDIGRLISLGNRHNANANNMLHSQQQSLGALLTRRSELAQILVQQTNDGAMTENQEQLAAATNHLQQMDRQIAQLKAQLASTPSEASTSTEPGRGVQLTLNKLGTGHLGDSLRKQEAAAETSMVSFTSDMENSTAPENGPFGQQRCQRVEVVYSLLSMLSSQDRLDSSQTLLLMSRAADTCQLMRQSGCVPILIQLLHPGDVWARKPTPEDVEVLSSAAEALQNLVQHQPDEKRKRREVRVLKLLDQVRAYTLHLRLVHAGMQKLVDAICGQEVGPAVSLLMKLSFDEQHRHTTTQLGGLQAVAELLISDQLVFGVQCPDSSLMVRKFVGMALTNLTFGDVQSKQTLCCFPRFLVVLNAQIDAPNDALRQVFASVLRNLSWKAETTSKQALRDSSSVISLMRAAIQAEKEATLKSVLSALWNLSAHCSHNKAEICRLPGALDFLVSTLNYRSNTNSLAVIENGGGILRNVSSQIAVSEEYRAVLRARGCFQILLRHLTSTSLTMVSNACGTLWNLSARCTEDQRILWELNAVPMLRSLVHSKHKMISMGATAALQNLLTNRPPDLSNQELGGGLMYQRRLKTLEHELDFQLKQVCDGNVGSLSPSAEKLHASGGSMDECSSSSKSLPAGRQVLELMSGLVQPVTLPFPPPHSSSVPPKSPEHTFGVRQSASSHALAKGAGGHTKQQQMVQDKAAVQRYHNSLRRRSDKGNVQQPFPYPPPSYPEPSEEDTVRSYAVEGTPLMSQRGSTSDLRCTGQEMNTLKEELLQENASKSASACASPSKDNDNKGIKSVTIASPVFSRHSSIQSLDSCEAGIISSNIHSAYSTQMPTRLVSPSDLPDSPSQTSPKRTPPKVITPPPETSPQSNNSSLSALTIDTDTKVKPSGRFDPPSPTFEDDPDYATFDPNTEQVLLERSIQSARPAPPKFAPSTRSRFPAVYSTYSEEGDLDCVKTFNYEGDGTPANEHTRNPSVSELSSGISSRAEPAQDLNELIRSALPKPKVEVSPKHRGKNVAIAKPMVRRPVAAEPEERTTVFAVEGTPRNRSRSASPQPEPKRGSRQSPRSAKSVESLSSEDLTLDKCISDALPKPKPKKGRRSSGHKTHNSWIDARIKDLQAQKGILESSAVSADLVQSGTSAFMDCSNCTALEDVLPPEDLMKISTVSALYRSENRCEKIKDASDLLARSGGQNGEPTPQPASVSATKQSSDGSECLSEDNYSRDDDFDIAPEDVDLNLFETDAHRFVLQLEGGADFCTSEDELLIDCETLSLVSNNSSRHTDTLGDSSDPSGPRILTGSSPESQPKPIRGQKKPLRPSLAGPKMAVRTTKAAQLRAKKASESSLDGKSDSPQKEEVKARASRSPRPGKKESPPKKEKEIKNDSKVGRRQCKDAPPPVPPKPKKYPVQKVNSFVRLDSAAVEEEVEKIPPDQPRIVQTEKGGPTVMVSPFNYQQPSDKKFKKPPPPSKSKRVTPSPKPSFNRLRGSPESLNSAAKTESRSESATRQKDKENDNSKMDKSPPKTNKENDPKADKPSSKRLLVTTV